MTTPQIVFYKPKELFYEFSNFYQCSIQLLNKEWLNAEQYYQAMKFYLPNSPEHMEYFELIHKTDSPMKAFALGCQKKQNGVRGQWFINKKTCKESLNNVINKYKHLKPRDDWDLIKMSIMTDVLSAKFTQHKYLKDLLLSTHNSEIIEDSPRDYYWGIGKNKNGQNNLGKLLVKVRQSLQNS